MLLSALLGIDLGVCVGLLSVGVRELLLGEIFHFVGALVVAAFAGLVGYLLYNLKKSGCPY